jgi:hypothetical protein
MTDRISERDGSPRASAHRAPPGRRRPRRPSARAVTLGGVAAVLALALAWLTEPGQNLEDRAGRGAALAVEFLARSQRETGELPTQAWAAADPAAVQEVRTPFTVSQALHALTVFDAGELGHRVRRRAVEYLLAHREPPGLWRYYGADDTYYAEVYARFRHPKLPPDVDDTAQAWAALVASGHAVDPAALEALGAARTPAGLFNTWIAPPDAVSWMDPREREVDLVVNLNALFLLTRVGRGAPEVCAHVDAATRSRAFERGTVWYPSPLAYAYFLSRAYADGGARCLADAAARIRGYVLAQQRANGDWGDDLSTALGTVTLLNTGPLGPEVRRAVQALLSRQAGDGGWRTAPLYRGAVFSYGSRPLTTAFGFEALGKFLARTGAR